VRRCYEEAAAIQRLAPNAFANQIRRALEALCRDRSAAGNTLAANLRDLAARGEIPAVLAEMTDILRLFGNIGSHADEANVEAGDVDAIDEFFRAVVEYVYVAPHRVSEVRARVEQVWGRHGGTR
jgi:glutamate-1-semialdehyde aminotransferase